jgi:hypothetical protein
MALVGYSAKGCMDIKNDPNFSNAREIYYIDCRLENTLKERAARRETINKDLASLLEVRDSLMKIPNVEKEYAKYLAKEAGYNALAIFGALIMAVSVGIYFGERS